MRPGASVEIAGVEVGKIDSITIRDYKAVVGMEIRKGIALQEDTIASVRTRGLIGEKYINLSPGASDRLIPPGGKSGRPSRRSTSRGSSGSSSTGA